MNNVKIPVSILVLTKNEQKDLPGCLESVSWSNDIHVYDSLSSDATVDIARAAGATVTSRQFDNWAAHQNWGLRNIKFANKWVFYIDADERVTPELAAEIARLIASPLHDAYRVQRRDFFLETWLKRTQPSPFYVRLFKPEVIAYERLVNPVTRVSGSTGQLSGYLDHFPFSKGLSHWIERHNSYSTLEARQIFENRKNNAKFSIIKAFVEKDFHARRYHQKELFYRIPCRPLVKFALFYLFRLGFLDGRAGFVYSTLQSIYEYFIVLKVKELEKSASD